MAETMVFVCVVGGGGGGGGGGGAVAPESLKPKSTQTKVCNLNSHPPEYFGLTARLK
jgi:hypothetical protein